VLIASSIFPWRRFNTDLVADLEFALWFLGRHAENAPFRRHIFQGLGALAAQSGAVSEYAWIWDETSSSDSWKYTLISNNHSKHYLFAPGTVIEHFS
jgi:hypothetical protein